MTPGSMPLARSIYQEGVRIPPIHLLRSGEVVDDVLALILANVRTPVEREGDLTAQIASNRTGNRRLLDLSSKYGAATVAEYMAHLQDYPERMTRQAISQIPDGSYRFEDRMDDDGLSSEPVPIVVQVDIDGTQARIDFTGTSPQVNGSINAIYAITLSAVMYCFRVIVPFAVPSNHGTIRPLELVVPDGSLLNADLPAAVAGGNVETSQRIVDVVLGAVDATRPRRSVYRYERPGVRQILIAAFDERRIRLLVLPTGNGRPAGSEHHALCARLDGRLKNVPGTFDVGIAQLLPAVVFARVGREMHNHFLAIERRPYRVEVGDVGSVGGYAVDVTAIQCRKLMVAFESATCGATDQPTHAGNKDSHETSPDD